MAYTSSEFGFEILIPPEILQAAVGEMPFWNELGEEIVNKAKDIIEQSVPEGRIYKGHVASAPGQPPATLTGELLENMFYDIDPETAIVIVGNNSPQGLYAEIGTVRELPRPFLRPAVDQVLSEWGIMPGFGEKVEVSTSGETFGTLNETGLAWMGHYAKTVPEGFGNKTASEVHNASVLLKSTAHEAGTHSPFSTQGFEHFGQGTHAAKFNGMDHTVVHEQVQPHEAASLKHYTSFGDRQMNSQLRGRTIKGETVTHNVPGTHEHITNIDQAMSRSSTVTDHVVFRGMGNLSSLLGIQKGDWNAAVGKSFVDHGFTSASLNHGVSRGFASGAYTHTPGDAAVITLKLPAGSRGIRLPSGMSHFDGEIEYLLDRGSTIKITGIKSLDTQSGRPIPELVGVISQPTSRGPIPDRGGPR